MTLDNLDADLGDRTAHRLRIASYGFIVIAVLIAGIALNRLYGLGTFDRKYWAIYGTASGWKFILSGLLMTLKVAMVDALLAGTVGIVIAYGQLSENQFVRHGAIIYAEVFRGVPTLLLVLFLYFGVPEFGPSVSPFWALVLGSALYNSAVLSNFFRAGILALGSGQFEAAFSLGFRRLGAMRHIVLPQAVRGMLPSLLAQFIVLLKDSSLGFFIGYEEVLRRSQIISGFSHNYLQAYFVVGCIYFLLCFAISRCGGYLEHGARRSTS